MNHASVPSSPANRVVRYQHNESRVHEWFTYSNSYFRAAKVLAKEYEIGDLPEDLFPPLIYNLRHGLELLLKFLAFSTGSTAGALSHHDIHRLFSDVQAALLALDEDSITFAAEGLELEESLVSKFLEAMVWTVEHITHKYYSYQFLAEGQQPIVDRKNELFRYPSSTASTGVFDAIACSNLLSASDAMNDIDTLHKFLFSMVLTFGRRDDGTHVLRT